MLSRPSHGTSYGQSVVIDRALRQGDAKPSASKGSYAKSSHDMGQHDLLRRAPEQTETHRRSFSGVVRRQSHAGLTPRCCADKVLQAV